MKLFDKTWIIMLMMSAVLVIPMSTSASSPTVIISEVAWAGSEQSSSDEWLELTNTLLESVDVSGWYLTGAGLNESNIVIPDETVIEPQSTYLISNYDQTNENSSLGVDPDLVTETLSLSNGGFAIYLYNNDGSQIDSAGDGSSLFAGRSGGAQDTDDGRYRSMARVDGLLDGSIETSWIDANTSIGFDPDATDFGTPGSVYNIEIVEKVFIAYGSGTIVITEFVSDPLEDKEEWIEVQNVSSETVDLAGWTIEDATERQTELGEGSLEAGEYLVIESPKGQLNNDSDTIVLRDGTGNEIDRVDYGTDEVPEPDKGQALVLTDDDAFAPTDILTPGENNIIEIVEVVENPEEEVDDTIEEEEDASLSHQSGTMLITEFVSNPLDDEVEWIEVQNVSSETIDLSGWTIEDATERQTELGEGLLEPNTYLVIESPKGQLNNDGDTIVLRDGAGNEIDRVEYGTEYILDPDKGQSMALCFNDVFEATDTTTPGETNVIEMIEEVEVVEEEEVVDETNPVEEIIEEETELESEIEEVIETEAEEQEEQTVVEEGYIGPTTLVFSELFPNTPGADADEEYIVITNNGTESVNLAGWFIQDESGNSHAFSSGNLDPGSVLTLTRPESGITLNNDGDALLLQSPDGTLVDYVSYGKAGTGARYVLNNDSWAWIEKGVEIIETTTVNEPVAALAPSSTLTSNTSSSTPSATYASSSSKQTTAYVYVHAFTVADAKLEPDGTEVSLSGIVTVEPGVFGKQIMYIQDLTGGIQIYKYDSEFPDISVGDLVSLTGELSTNRAERRVKLSSDSSISVAQGNLAEPTNLVSIDAVGSLVHVSGLVQSKASSSVTLEENGAESILYFGSSSDLISEVPARGTRVEVVGVLTNSNGELRIRPRSKDDIVIIEEEAEDVVLSATTGKDNYSSMQSTVGWILVLVTAATLGLLAVRKYFPAGRKHVPA